MIVHRSALPFALFFFMLLIPATAPAEGKLPVFVSIVPQKTFVERIGGERVAVSVMVQPGASPATYEPKPRQMVELSRAKLYFAIGVPFEKAWLPRIADANRAMQIVHTEEAIAKVPMKAHHHHDEEAAHHDEPGESHHHEAEETEHEHPHGEPRVLDPHVWLSPPLVMLQARSIVRALERVDPEGREVYASNYRDFIAEIVDLDNELRETFQNASAKGTQFMVFHPAWGYFARAYGLEQVPIEIEGKEPKPAELQQLIEYARSNSLRVIFAQPQFSSKSAELVARGIGGEVALVDPLAADWARNLKEAAARFKSALR